MTPPALGENAIEGRTAEGHKKRKPPGKSIPERILRFNKRKKRHEAKDRTGYNSYAAAGTLPRGRPRTNGVQMVVSS